VTASNLPSAQLRQSIDVEELPPEAVVPVGLVMLELVSNAREHSGGRTDLEIRVELTRDGERYRVIVADNGVGFPDGFDPKAARSLG
ncbi:ATP-binding protein, partial [Acinetobacter baumannii]